MTTINQAYINALLADAAYRSVNPAMTAQVLSDELTSRMTAEQAAFIAANFTVKDSIETPNSINSLLDPGFDAVVWEGKAGTPYAGQVYVSMRGTQGATDIADDISLATKGIPYDQIVSMVNWWLKNTASTTNTKVPQIKVVDIPGEVIGRTFALDVPTTGTGKLEALNTITGVNGHSLGGYLATAFTRLFGNGWNVREVNTFNSAGFSNLMTTNTNGEFSNTANMIGSSLGLDDFSAVASKQTNYYADNGWSLTTNAWGEIGFLMPGFNQYGARTALYQEKSVEPWGNHSMYKLTDLLALGVALEKLDPSMTIAKLNELVKAGSNDMKASYEGVLNGLQCLFLDSTIGSLPIGDAGPNDSSRVVFHQTLRQLQDSNQFKSLLGAVRFDFCDTSLAAKARTDFSALASLISLSPVTLNAKDAAGQAALDAALKSAWGQTYLDWEADKALSQEAFESGEGTYTKNYLEDRAALLQAIVTRNQKDETSGTLVSDLAPADRNLQFQWYGATPLPGETQLGVATLTLAQANGSIRPVQKIAFGNENSNAVIGTDGKVGDHLYGGGGDDVMTGLAGADYLEGNTGNDKLEGGAGSDKLLGGAGDDVLDGGADNDDLRGGVGTDTYVFSGKFGMDTVVDAGGQGSVEVVGLGHITGSGAIKETETGWVSADKKIRYNLSGTTLSIDVVDGGTQGRIFIEDWSNGVLGISLPTMVKEPPAGPLALFGDFTKARDSENRYIRDGLGNFTSSGIAIGASDVFFGGVSGDYLSGLAGDDLIYGHAGDDVVLGGDGSDILHGGLGADTIRGGEGNDLIYGSSTGPAQTQDSSAPGWDGYYVPLSYPYFIQANLAAAGKVFGSYGKDEVTGVQAGWSWVEYRDPSIAADRDGFYDTIVSDNVLRDRQDGDAGNVIDAGPGNDWVLAGTGDDFVEGGAGKDDIYGMDGRDVINAGDGDDRVYGDGTELMAGSELAVSTPWAQGRDYIDGGTGNDTLVGGGLSDAVFGGDGNDLVFGDARWENVDTAVWDGDDYLDGGAGEDFLVGSGGSDALFGGTGNDHLFGDAMNAEHSQATYDGFDLLDGESGDDQLIGGGRDDTLLGGQGNDSLWGDDEPGKMPGLQVGADVLSGGAGDDQLIGGGGADTLNGGDGNDYLSGDAPGLDQALAGNDQLFGEAGEDTLSGDDGDDLLDGGAENDLLVGGIGNDTLIGGAGTDVLQGGDGNDTYVFGAGESPVTPEGYAEVVNDSSGSNRIVMNSGGSLLVGVDGAGAFAMQSATGHLNLHSGTVGTMSSFEVDGAQYSLASLVGRFADRSMTLVDSSGRTQVLGGRSNDNLSTFTAGALISGGLGNDTINITSKLGVSVEMAVGDGIDKITAAKRQTATAAGQSAFASAGSQNILKLGVGIVQSDLKLFGNSGSDAFFLKIGDSGDGLQFTASKASSGAPMVGAQPFDLFQFADGTSLDWVAFMAQSPVTVFVATEGNDSVTLTVGADVFSALGGDDSIEGLGGNDVLSGMAGNDTLRGGIGNDLLDEGEGDGLLDGGDGDDTLQGGAGLDTLLGGSGSDLLDGGEGDGLLDGGDGNDTLQAGSGVDTLKGGNGDDVLRGGDGSNLLLGNSGNDSLYGGLSSAFDTMMGGDGSDHYFFNFRPGGYNFADALDEATASDDVYHVVTSGSTGASNFQIFNISDAGGNDKIVFDSNWITPSTMAVVYTGTGFSLRGWTNFSINMIGVVDAAENFTSGMLESVQFKDGTVWTADQFRARSQLTSAEADSILGFNSNDTIDGGAGNDTLNGGGGADLILGGEGYDKVNGGLGNDTLEAGAGGGLLIGDLGDDVYVLRAGHGSVEVGSGLLGDAGDAGSDILDVAALSSAVTLSILRGSGPADIDFLAIAFNDGSANAKVALVGYGPDSVDGVEFVRFSDGSVINVSQFVASKRVAPTSGADSITGTSLSESIDGGLGNDYLNGRAGSDTLIGGGGDDTLSGSVGANVYEPGTGNDLIEISGGNDTLRLGQGSGRDKIWFSPVGGTVTVEYGTGISSQGIRLAWSSFNQETYRYQNSGPMGGQPYLYFMGSLTLSNGLGDDVKMDINSPSNQGALRLSLEKIRMSDGTLISIPSLLASTAGDDLMVPLIGDGLAVMDGGAGNDTIVGFDTERTLDGGAGNDLLLGGDSTDRLIGGAGNDTLRGYAGDNTYVYDRGDGDDQIVLTPEVASTQTVEFGQGISVNDVTLKRTYDNLIVSVAGGGSITLSSVGLAHSLPVALRFADGTTWTQDQIKIKVETSGSGNDTLVGYGVESYNNVNFGNDSLFGGAGDDVLIGLNGSDTLIGGTGNDSLYADQLPRSPRDPAPDGNTGIDRWSSDVLDGGAGDDVLYEGTGRATFRFDMGFGHDRIVRNSSRQASEAITIEFGVGVSSGDIQVSTSAQYGYVLSMPATADSIEVALQENDLVTFANGTVWNLAALESRKVSAITEASDLILGTTGADIVAGRGGDDLVYAGEGNDLLDGGSGNDMLNGDAGDDTLIGGIGNDTLYDFAGNDRYLFSLGDGQDTITDSGGNADVLVFGAGITAANIIVKSDPAGANSGIYEFSIAGTGDKLTTKGLDNIIFGDGAQWARSDFDALARTVFGTSSNDTMTGAASADRMMGLAGNDSLSGLAGDDWLDGGVGADTMSGGAGNDVFVVDDISDVVIESAGQGTDKVFSSISYVLPTNLEDLELTGAAPINATGNSAANFLIGNDADNVLDGGSGNDTLIGGAGNDTYLVDSTNDVVTEAASGGVDSVASAASYSLSDNIENLSLTGTSAINATGNRLNNTLTGNVGNNRLDGGEGADTLSGGAGNDTYVVDNVGDFIIEAAAGGSDLVETSLTWTLAAELENLTLTGSAGVDGTGNSLDNRVTGNAGANRLDGGAGADTLVGGAGNDVYVVDSASDVVTELAAGGIDTVQSAVTFSLGANVENLTLTGNGAINATGNTVANVLTGNAGSNVLAGGAGNDTMQGGAGDDSYVVADAGDVVNESANEGNDQVQASVTFALSSNVERLTLTGANAINGTGNDLANVLLGNSAANKLTGGAGDDSLDGGAGIDTMAGGTGNDSYTVDVVGDVITELTGEGIDSVSSGVSYTLSTNVENLTLTGTTGLAGTGNASANVLVGNSGNNTLTGGAGNDSLDGGLGNDTMLGGAGDDVYTVNVASDVVTELANEGVDTIMSAVTLTLLANVENLSLTGTTALNGTGNTVANALTGNAGANSLSGLAGNDTLDGGAGNDTLNGGLGADTYLFGRGYGADLLIDSDATAGVVDVVAFGAGILSTDVQFTQSGNALVAAIRGSSDKLTIQDWYLGTQNRVEQFRFADGNTLTGQQAQALVGAMAAFSSGSSSSPMVANDDQMRQPGIAVSAWI